MPATPVDSFLIGRVWINCDGGGYEHVYPMIASTFAQAATDLTMICKALSMVLEGNSYIADAVLSSYGGMADGYQIGRATDRVPVNLIQSGSLGTETSPGIAQDPSKGIRWRLDTGLGLVTTRLLRSIRSAWIQSGVLVQGVSNPSNAGAAIGVGTSPVAYAGYLQVGTSPYNAADCLSNYFSIVRDKTARYIKNPAAPPKFLQYGYLAANGTPGLPDWSLLGTSRRTIGKGWPQVRGRQAKFS